MRAMHRKLEKVYYEIRAPAHDVGRHRRLRRGQGALRQMVCLPLQRPADVARMGLVPPAAILLWGPLGTGLAMLPEACATEAGVGYVYVSGREILGKPEALVETLREAEREAPGGALHLRPRLARPAARARTTPGAPRATSAASRRRSPTGR